MVATDEVGIMLEKCGHPDFNVFHLKRIIGTHGNWKKSKSLWPFWSYQLDSTANPAHLPRKWAKWAKLAVVFSMILIFSIAMGADYSFEMKNIEI